MAEAVRRLTIAKEKEIVLDMEIKRGARIPIEDVSLTEKYHFFFWAYPRRDNREQIIGRAEKRNSRSIAKFTVSRNQENIAS